MTFFSSFNEFGSLMTADQIVNRKNPVLRKANSVITRFKN